jgi:DNA-binding MarR family transcriptional regulator
MSEAPPSGTADEDHVLVRAARTFVGMSVRAADQLGPVSLVQLRALTVIDDIDGANLIQLSDGMGVTVSTASRLVDRLVGAGLVDRRPSEVTRREISLRLTPEGRALLSRYDGLRLDALRRRLDQLPRRRRVALIHALGDLLDTDAPPRDA